MNAEVRYHPMAVAELVEAQAWYEQKGEGLGDRFVAATETAVGRISRWPGSGTPVVVELSTVVNRKAPIGGFPWALGYEIADDIVIVLAVFHQHRRPGYWTGRQR